MILSYNAQRLVLIVLSHVVTSVLFIGQGGVGLVNAIHDGQDGICLPLGTFIEGTQGVMGNVNGSYRWYFRNHIIIFADCDCHNKLTYDVKVTTISGDLANNILPIIGDKPYTESAHIDKDFDEGKKITVKHGARHGAFRITCEATFFVVCKLEKEEFGGESLCIPRITQGESKCIKQDLIAGNPFGQPKLIRSAVFRPGEPLTAQDIGPLPEISADEVQDYADASPLGDGLLDGLASFTLGDNLEGTCNGDPHFTSWGGKRFDFHGECDLVLATSPSFGNGQGLDVHIRTTMVSRAAHPYSYISEAAVRVGQQVLAVDRNGFWFDGTHHTFEEDNISLALSGYNIYITDSQTKKGKFMKKIMVDLTNGHSVTIKAANSHIDVSVNTKNWREGNGYFDDLVGLLGRHRDRAMVDRNGNLMINAHANDLGQMWQVREWENTLFPEPVSPQHPVKCNLPPATQTSRHLRSIADAETLQNASVACEHVRKDEDRDNCVFDVLASGDIDMAEFYE